MSWKRLGSNWESEWIREDLQVCWLNRINDYLPILMTAKMFTGHLPPKWTRRSVNNPRSLSPHTNKDDRGKSLWCFRILEHQWMNHHKAAGEICGLLFAYFNHEIWIFRFNNFPLDMAAGWSSIHPECRSYRSDVYSNGLEKCCILAENQQVSDLLTLQVGDDEGLKVHS